MVKLTSSDSKQYWITALIAIIAAFINASINQNGLLPNAIPWGILAFVISFLTANNRKQALWLCAIFGFVVSYSYLWFDNHGIKSLTQVLFLIPVVVAPSLFGALCGSVCGYIGWKVRRLLRKNSV